jgi:hypothetical protein
MTRARDVANVLSTATALATDAETSTAISNERSASATLTNKTISGSNNTLSNIPNSSLSYSSITLNGSSVSLGGSANIGLSIVSVSSNITLSANTRYLVNTTAARTLTLPSLPSNGDEIQIFDASGTAATYNITIDSNSGKINGSVQNAILDVNGVGTSLIYTGSTYGWRLG